MHFIGTDLDLGRQAMIDANGARLVRQPNARLLEI